ncbi:MAG: ATP-binding cassette domain-containing protein [Acidimicrobiia bacterium]
MWVLRRHASPAVSATDLSRRFGPVEAVRGVSFEIAPGEVFALLGSAGSGRSTILQMLSTLVRPTGGRATVAGYDIAEQPRAVQRRAWMVAPDRPPARSRFHVPDVLLVDGPGDFVWNEARRLQGEGVAIVYGTDRPADAEAADRVAIVDQGLIVALDTPAGLTGARGRSTLDDAFAHFTGHPIDMPGGDALGAARRFMASHRR